MAINDVELYLGGLWLQELQYVDTTPTVDQYHTLDLEAKTEEKKQTGLVTSVISVGIYV